MSRKKIRHDSCLLVARLPILLACSLVCLLCVAPPSLTNHSVQDCYKPPFFGLLVLTIHGVMPMGDMPNIQL
ncbi:hypothetical protein V8C35DRAFT_270316 [Trichoderma chlorosporum]